MTDNDQDDTPIFDPTLQPDEPRHDSLHDAGEPRWMENERPDDWTDQDEDDWQELERTRCHEPLSPEWQREYNRLRDRIRSCDGDPSTLPPI